MSDIENDQPTLMQKIEKDPLPAVGICGLLGVVGYSLFNYKNKSAATKTSIYVIQTRVAAQGVVIGLLTLGCFYRIINALIYPESRKPKNEARYSGNNEHVIGTQRYK